MKKFTIIIIALAISGMLHAATYYVAKTGNNTNPGTATLPWLTIQKGANTAQSGDIVIVKNGTYNERVVPPNSGVTFLSENLHGAIIDGTGITASGNWNGLVDIYEKSNITFSGFEIRNANTNAVRFGILIQGGDKITIKNNYIHGMLLSAIDVFWEQGVSFSPATNLVIDGNEITDVQIEGSGQEIITLANVNGFEIKNNRIYGNHNHESIAVMKGAKNGSVHHNDIQPVASAGIYIYGWKDTDPVMENINIYSNKIYGGGSGVRGIAIASESGGAISHIKIFNNIVYNTGGGGIVLASYNGSDCWPFNGTNPCHSGPENDIQIINNTVYNTDHQTGWWGGITYDNKPNFNPTNVVMRNNISWNNAVNQITPPPGATYDHNYTISPGVVNVAGGDFHLNSGSPAIDAGSSIDAPSTDFDGNSRPQGAGYDIGAYEYVTPTVIGNVDETENGIIIYPNPAQGNAQLEINLSEKENVQINIYNILGEELGIIANGEMSAGTHKLNISAHISGAGVYFIRVKSGDSVINRKLINFIKIK